MPLTMKKSVLMRKNVTLIGLKCLDGRRRKKKQRSRQPHVGECN
jgi:hypothetical protein